MRLFGFIVLSFVTTILLLSAFILWVGFKPMDNVYATALSTPIIWLAAMFYCYWDDKAWRPLVIMGLLSIFSGIYVYLSPVPSV